MSEEMQVVIPTMTVEQRLLIREAQVFFIATKERMADEVQKAQNAVIEAVNKVTKELGVDVEKTTINLDTLQYGLKK